MVRVRFLTMCMLLAVAALLANSCKTDERASWGDDFITEQEKLKIAESVTSDFIAWTDTTNLGIIRNPVEVVIGEIYDPIFGLQRSGLTTQLLPNKLSLPAYQPGTTVLDSVYLRFRIGAKYENEPLEIKVSLLKNPVVLNDSTHRDPKAKEEEVLTTYELNAKYGDLVRIPLNQSGWGTRYLAELANHLSSYNKWLDFCKGFRITARRKTQADNKGSMVRFNMANAQFGVFFFWKTRDTVRSLKLGLVNELKRYMLIEKDRTGSELKSTVQKSQQEQNLTGKTYVDAGGDVRTVIDLSSVYKRWKDSVPTTILRAELRIPLSNDNSPLSDTLISRLYTFLRVNDRFVNSPDVDKGKAVYDGYYNRKKGYYSLNLTYSIQALLRGELPENQIYLVGDTQYLGFGRAILNNTSVNSTPMQLVLTYIHHK